MARFLCFSLLVTLFLAFDALFFFTPGIAIEVDPYLEIVPDYDLSPEPVYAEIKPFSDDYDLAPDSNDRNYEYIESCAAKLTEECGEDTFWTLLGRKIAVGDHCCHKVVGMGKHCHEELVKVLASIPEYKSYAPEIPKKGREIWDQCVSLVEETAL